MILCAQCSGQCLGQRKCSRLLAITITCYYLLLYIITISSIIFLSLLKWCVLSDLQSTQDLEILYTRRGTQDMVAGGKKVIHHNDFHLALFKTQSLYKTLLRIRFP